VASFAVFAHCGRALAGVREPRACLICGTRVPRQLIIQKFWHSAAWGIWHVASEPTSPPPLISVCVSRNGYCSWSIRMSKLPVTTPHSNCFHPCDSKIFMMSRIFIGYNPYQSLSITQALRSCRTGRCRQSAEMLCSATIASFVDFASEKPSRFYALLSCSCPSTRFRQRALETSAADVAPESTPTMTCCCVCHPEIYVPAQP
jgi:hypothetical protein